MESPAQQMELGDPPILVCVKLLTPGLQRDTEAKLVRVPVQSHYTYTEHSADGRRGTPDQIGESECADEDMAIKTKGPL